MADDEYETKLSPDDERSYHKWKADVAPDDSGADYDLRGAFKAGEGKAGNGHMTDKFKKPNHPTFSDQSKYAVGPNRDRAGHWVEDTFIPPANK